MSEQIVEFLSCAKIGAILHDAPRLPQISHDRELFIA